MRRQIDVLSFGAHPDDVEFVMGGTLLRLAALEYTTGIIDLTRGERSTRGTPAERAAEASAAAAKLGLAHRETLDLGDGHLHDDSSTRAAVGNAIRRLRPRIIFTHHEEELHPDHAAAARIVRAAAYLAGVAGWEPDPALERHRPSAVVHFGLPCSNMASFIVDVSDFAEQKQAAIRCHASQLHDPRRGEPATAISHELFLDRLEARQRYFGALIQARHGEAFCTREPLAIEDPVSLLARPMNLLV